MFFYWNILYKLQISCCLTGNDKLQYSESLPSLLFEIMITLSKTTSKKYLKWSWFCVAFHLQGVIVGTVRRPLNSHSLGSLFVPWISLSVWKVNWVKTNVFSMDKTVTKVIIGFKLKRFLKRAVCSKMFSKHTYYPFRVSFPCFFRLLNFTLHSVLH